MNLDDQIKLIKLIISLPKSENVVNLSNDTNNIIYQHMIDTITINLLRNGNHDIIMALDWDEKNDTIEHKRPYGSFVLVENVTSIIQDYEELDINQFILIRGRDPFKWNEYNFLKIILELLENDIELR